MNYIVKTKKTRDLDGIEEARISYNPWNTPYEPDTRFRGAYIEGEGFLFQLVCYEKNPRITLEFHEGYGPCLDSCMELFFNFAPERSNEYLNFEMNAGESYLYGIGAGRDDRRDIQTSVMPTSRSVVFEDRWESTLFIPLETIEELYGKIDFCDGYRFIGNAYKCGDLTEIEHYLSWNPVLTETPDFHRPEYFGTFTIAK